MATEAERALAEFERAITPQRLRAMRLIHVAFPLSLVAFGVVLGAVSANAPEKAAEGAAPLARILSVANAVVFFGAWSAGGLLFNLLLSPGRIARAVEASRKSSAEACLDQLQLASLLRLICLDASACFALAVCVVLILKGILPRERGFWFNGLPACVLAAYALYTLPSVPRLRVLFLVKIARQFHRR